jgi:hypothetical protein
VGVLPPSTLNAVSCRDCTGAGGEEEGSKILSQLQGKLLACWLRYARQPRRPSRREPSAPPAPLPAGPTSAALNSREAAAAFAAGGGGRKAQAERVLAEAKAAAAAAAGGKGGAAAAKSGAAAAGGGAGPDPRLRSAPRQELNVRCGVRGARDGGLAATRQLHGPLCRTCPLPLTLDLFP